MTSKNKMVVGGLGVYGLVSATTYFYFRGRKGDPEAAAAAAAAAGGSVVGETARRVAFSSQAKCYDDQVGLDETLMGMTLLR